MATFDVSKAGNNLTAVADDPLLPWRDIGAAFNAAGDNDLVNVEAGIWTSEELETSSGLGYALINDATSLDGAGTATVIQSDSVTANLRWQGNFDGQTVNVSNVRCESGGAIANAYIYLNNTGSSGTPFTVNITEIECDASVAALGGIFVTGGDIALMVDGYSFTGDQSLLTTGNRGAAINARVLEANSVISINNVTLDITNRQNSSPVIDIEAEASGVSCELIGTQGTVNFISTFPSQECQMQQILNIDDAVIDGKNKTITITTNSPLGTASAAVIDCDSASLTAHRGIIQNAIVNHAANGGFGFRYGHDGTNAFDDLCNDGSIFNCTVQGGDKFREGGGHGIFFGNNSGGNSSFCKVSEAALSLLSKNTNGGGHFAHECERFGRPSDGAGSAIQSKGCNGTQYFGSRINVTADCFGAVFVGNSDNATNNIGVSVESNLINIMEVTSPNLAIMSFGALQDVNFKKNIYINTDAVTRALPMNNAGAGISIAEWTLTVEPDAIIHGETIPLAIGTGTGTISDFSLLQGNLQG